jgi:hypothetical protein
MVSLHRRTLPLFSTLVCALSAGLAGADAWAQSPTVATPTQATATTAAAAASAPAPARPVLASTHSAPVGQAALPGQPPAPPANEAAATRTVVEDEAVRIEEVKVRGQVQRITVHSKLRGVAPYQIVPPNAAREPGAPGQLAGQRLWSFDF